MKKLSLFSAAAVAALLFPVAGLAQQEAQPAEPQTRTRAARPQFTDAQRDALRTLSDEHRKTSEAARRELAELNVELAKTLAAATIDDGRLNDLKTRITQKEAELAAAQVDYRAKAAAVLTPEQRQAMGERTARAREFGQRGMRGEHRHRGTAMRRGDARARARGMMWRGQRDDARLHERVRQLEQQLEALRNKIG